MLDIWEDFCIRFRRSGKIPLRNWKKQTILFQIIRRFSGVLDGPCIIQIEDRRELRFSNDQKRFDHPIPIFCVILGCATWIAMILRTREALFKKWLIWIRTQTKRGNVWISWIFWKKNTSKYKKNRGVNGLFKPLAYFFLAIKKLNQ